ncbi:MAG TPA: DUF2461 domain-containing protein [Anaerolineales bacterium]|nr:DUF2461 domain-containing protein [Anaerolineales bacterium]
MSSFPGFPKEALKFFKDIQENNNREWFEANKSNYLTHVQEPAVEFVIALGARLQAISPDIQFDTATNGSGSVMRIYRDTRFSKDKTPYKDWLSIGLWGGSKKNHHSGVYFGFSSDGGGIHIGSHEFSKEFLAAYRSAVAGVIGEELQTALDQIGEGFTVRGEKLKTVPKEFPADHPRGELLKHKSLYVSAPPFSASDIYSPELVEMCVKYFRKALPVHRWMVKVGEARS